MDKPSYYSSTLMCFREKPHSHTHIHHPSRSGQTETLEPIHAATILHLSLMYTHKILYMYLSLVLVDYWNTINFQDLITHSQRTGLQVPGKPKTSTIMERMDDV